MIDLKFTPTAKPGGRGGEKKGGEKRARQKIEWKESESAVGEEKERDKQHV